MKNLNPTEFKEAISSPDVFILDVRDADSFNESHIRGAHNLDVESPDFKEQAEETLPKDKQIAVYCRTGKHSALASQILTDLGYNVLNLEEGLTSWIASGLPVVK